MTQHSKRCFFLMKHAIMAFAFFIFLFGITEKAISRHMVMSVSPMVMIFFYDKSGDKPYQVKVIVTDPDGKQFDSIKSVAKEGYVIFPEHFRNSPKGSELKNGKHTWKCFIDGVLTAEGEFYQKSDTSGGSTLQCKQVRFR